MQKTITIGTRGSQLALYQANKVKSLLAAVYPDFEINLEMKVFEPIVIVDKLSGILSFKIEELFKLFSLAIKVVLQ